MAMEFATYKDSINFFKMISYKSDEYHLKGNFLGAPIKKVPTIQANTLVLENLVLEQKELENHRAITVVKKEAIERFHPNNIDNKDFWVECRNQFPLLSVCGGTCKSIKQVNKKTSTIPDIVGITKALDILISGSQEKLNLLEIGFGYGGLFFKLKDKCNYYGIDYIVHKSLKKYKNFIEIEKSGIPDFLLDEGYFDIVYSVNVLQHCSQLDRFNYFEQSHRALKQGGHMLFTLNLMTKKNKDDNCWGFIDEKGRGYTNFFNQLTECDWDYELYYMLSKIGFEPVSSAIGSNFFGAIIRKK